MSQPPCIEHTASRLALRFLYLACRTLCFFFRSVHIDLVSNGLRDRLGDRVVDGHSEPYGDGDRDDNDFVDRDVHGHR